MLSALSFGYLATILNAVIGIALTPFILIKLGVVAFGVWAVVAEVLAYAVLLDFGVTGAISTLVAVASGKAAGSSERIELSQITSSGFMFHNVASLFVLCLGLVISYIFVNSGRGALQLPEDTLIAIAVLLLARAIDIGGVNVVRAVLVGRQVLGPLSFFNLVGSLLSSLCIFILLLLDFKLLALGLAELARTIVLASAAYWLYRRHARDIEITMAHGSVVHLSRILRLGGWLSLGSLAMLLMQRADNLVTFSILGPASVTVLGITRRVADIFTSIINQAVNWMRPGLGQIVGGGNKEKLKQIFLMICSLVGIVGTSLAVCTVLINPYFVAAWVGPQLYGGDALNIVVGALLVLNTITLPCRAILTAGKHLRDQSIIFTCEALTNLALSICLAKSMGIIGVMLGTLIPRILFSSIGLAIIVQKKYEFRFTQTVMTMYKPLWLIGIPAATVLWLVLRWLKPTHLWQLIVPGFTGVVMCVLAGMLFYGHVWSEFRKRLLSPTV